MISSNAVSGQLPIVHYSHGTTISPEFTVIKQVGYRGNTMFATCGRTVAQNDPDTKACTRGGDFYMSKAGFTKGGSSNPSETIPQVFIIESLDFEDEADRLEGKVLADVLAMCGKQPRYFYFRTAAELAVLADKFYESKYRYLHLSCHGSNTSIHTTLDSIPYVGFAEMFSGKLIHRRLFASACEVGNELFSEVVGGRNKGMHSIAAPADAIRFDVAVSFWAAFYVKAFSINDSSMRAADITTVFRPLCSLFDTRLHWSRYSNKRRKWEHAVIHH
jgi:hypothetical protein